MWNAGAAKGMDVWPEGKEEEEKEGREEHSRALGSECAGNSRGKDMDV